MKVAGQGCIMPQASPHPGIGGKAKDRQGVIKAANKRHRGIQNDCAPFSIGNTQLDNQLPSRANSWTGQDGGDPPCIIGMLSVIFTNCTVALLLSIEGRNGGHP